MPEVKIFSGSASQLLSEKIAAAYGTSLGNLTITRFSDGEISASFDESIRGAEVFLIQSLYPPADNLMELMLMIDAAKRASAANVNVVVPYYGYARQDRKDKPRVAIGAKVVADALQGAGATRIMTCDLHAGQIQGFFDIPVDHLNGSAIFIPYLKNLNLDNLIFASPDVGGLVRTRTFAKNFEAEMVVCDKRREKPNEVASIRVIGNVENKDVVIVDDIVDTAGTICKSANLLKEMGARSVRAVITHPVLSGSAYEKIENSALEELVVSDSIPLKEKSSKIKVLTFSELFSKAIGNVVTNESISSLFL